jgi:hypothetical protein
MNKFTYKYVKQIVENVDGYKLLSTEYIGSGNKIKIQCDKGHIFEMSFVNFKSGHRCSHPDCMNEKNRQSNLSSINDVKLRIKNEGYELLDSVYYGAKEKYLLRCPEGHEFKMRFSAFNQGQRCPICDTLSKRNSIETIKEFLNLLNYKLLCDYERAIDNIKIQCDKGHIFEMRYNSLQQGQRCPECSKSKMFSKGEKEILNYIKEKYNGKLLSNDRTTILNPKTGRYLELDIWLPEIRKAIEYNGYYWHNNKYSKWKDKYKQKWCRNNGIELLMVDHNDWKNNNVSVMNKVEMFIYGT